MSAFRYRAWITLALWSCLATIGHAQISTRYIPADAFMAAYLKPKDVAESPSLEMMPREVLSAMGNQAIGIDPVAADSALLFIRTPQGPETPRWGMVVSFEDPQTLSGEYLQQCVEDELDGKPFYVNEGYDNPPSLYAMNDRTIFIGDSQTIRDMVGTRMVDTPLTRRLARSGDVAPDGRIVIEYSMVRELLLTQLEQAPAPPPPFNRFMHVLEDVEAIEVDVQLNDGYRSVVTVEAIDEDRATAIQETIIEGLQLGRTMLLAQMQQEMLRDPDDPTAGAMFAYMERISTIITTKLEPARDGKNLELEMTDQFAAVPVLVALLLPAVQSAREAARRVSSQNNLKQIALAMHNYHDTHDTFPTQAIYDEDGKPLLSWRVAILPYVDEIALYERFHLDEPWDSEHNLQLLEFMPLVYANPNLPETTKTNYLALIGKGSLMSGKKGASFGRIGDGSSNTLMFVEADPDAAVPWSAPEDLPFDAEDPLAHLGGLRPNGFNAAMCDGSVRFFANTVDWDTFRALVTIAGGEAISDF